MSTKTIIIEGRECHVETRNVSIRRKIGPMVFERVGKRRVAIITLEYSLWHFEGSSVRQVVRMMKEEFALRAAKIESKQS